MVQDEEGNGDEQQCSFRPGSCTGYGLIVPLRNAHLQTGTWCKIIYKAIHKKDMA